jgi:hypothetical protein
MTPYKAQICGIGIMIFCSLACILYAEKNKTIATIAALTIIMPTDLIYLGQIDLDDPTNLLIRTIPIVGNIYSLYRIHGSKTLEPVDGWSDRIF